MFFPVTFFDLPVFFLKKCAFSKSARDKKTLIFSPGDKMPVTNLESKVAQKKTGRVLKRACDTTINVRSQFKGFSTKF